MEFQLAKKDWIFFLFCFLLAILAEQSFFHGVIGISYFVFIVAFYLLFFWRFQKRAFSHQRVGYLILIAIWFLSASYFLYSSDLFYFLNILVIPSLVIFHIVLITSPKGVPWYRLTFLYPIFIRVIDSFIYIGEFFQHLTQRAKESDKAESLQVWRKIFIGVAISLPILLVVLNLLISADSHFESLLGSLPEFFNFNAETFVRVVLIIIFTFAFFSMLQALFYKKAVTLKEQGTMQIQLDGIIVITALILLNVVYLLFVAVQFKYFFSGTLVEGYTYAEYFRKGFFELLFVTIINLVVLTGALYLSKNTQGSLKKSIQGALSLLILLSGIILVSAFLRLLMYEDAYGFTFSRVLIHTFMIFLMVIFAYTLIKVWLERLSLGHFYFIASLVYYTGINVIHIDKIVVEENMERFEETGELDIHYLAYFSPTGLLALVELYEKSPEVPGLKNLLMNRKDTLTMNGERPWQSINWTRDKAMDELAKLEIN